MTLKLVKRMLCEPDRRLLAMFLWNMCWKGMLAVNKYKRRLKDGECFPAFVFLSITNSCNLKCQGCWVSPTNPPQHLPLDTADRVITEAKRKGCRFFGLLGGEPLMHPDVFEIIGNHRDCYFQIFSNGTLMTDAAAGALRRLGNVTPLISIEGLEEVSDVRRGGSGVYTSAMEALENCRRNGLITGVATSICQSNYEDLVSEQFVHGLIDRGVHYLWYYVYRAVGPNPCPELLLTADQIVSLRRFMVDIRGRAPIAVVDAYWNDKGEALCPAAIGISHHINPFGDVEPCPIVQFASENVGTGEETIPRVANSEFLREFRRLACDTTQGCIIMERPELLEQAMKHLHARDSSGRGTAFAELAAMVPHHSHDLPGREIPERHWLYRFAKKYWFFGFGAYG